MNIAISYTCVVAVTFQLYLCIAVIIIIIAVISHKAGSLSGVYSS